MAVDCEVDLFVAARFLDFMAEGERVTFQTFDDSEQHRPQLAQIHHGDVGTCGRALRDLNAQGAGVYWMVNYGDGLGRRAENVTGVRCLFLDLDGAPLQPVLDAGVDPHAIVESSPGKWHVYWQVSGCQLEQFKPAQQALANRFGGDPSVCDLPRVLRVPGFLHCKSDPIAVRLERLEPLQPHRFDDLVRRLKIDLSAPAPKAMQTPRIDAETGEILGKVAPGGRHAHLVKWAAQLNFRGMPPEAVHVALQTENERACDPPKSHAEVEGIARDILSRYASQHGRDLIAQQEGAEHAEALLCVSADDPLAALSRFIVTDEQVQAMKETRLIWRDIIAMSHLSVWSAPGNGGKTSLAKFAAGELAADRFTVLFFQEDASAGDLPGLHQHAKEHGYRLLNSTLAGSAPEDQIKVLRALVSNSADLSEWVMFFDTLKKYTDLMSKGGARSFFQMMRSMTQRGATVVLLGHTNKHKGVDGKLIFEGVGDVRNDVDEMLYIEATDKDAAGVVTLTIKPDKVRCAVKEASFTLDTRTMEVTPCDSVVDVASILETQRRAADDPPVIEAVRSALTNGGMSHTELIDAVMRTAGTPRARVRDVVDRYCSTDPSDPKALWIETRMRSNNFRHIGLKPGTPR